MTFPHWCRERPSRASVTGVVYVIESKRADAFEEVAAVVFLGARELEFDHEVSICESWWAGHIPLLT